MTLWNPSASDKNSSNDLATFVEQFTVGNDFQLDQQLVPYDVQGSIGHVKGLEKAGLISSDEAKQLMETLHEVLKLWEASNFEVKREHEDCHTAIEMFLTEKLGDTGKKVHTGRSRNDQIMTVMRLFMRDYLNKIFDQSSSLAADFLNFAKKYESMPMPGYTHTQRAMLSSVGMWSGSMAEMLLSNLNLIQAAYKNVNQCPLGSAAAFGTAFPIDREYVSGELGFAAPVTISLSVQNMRGKLEADVLAAMVSVGSTLAHFASDLVLYTTKEFDFFTVDQALTTGSSIMPQKKNLDTAELLRARQSQLIGWSTTARSVVQNLTSGYHRDLQLTKEPIMRGLSSIQEMLQMAHLLITNITPNEEQLRGACTPELFATDYANDLVMGGMPFRDAYVEVKNNLDKLENVDIDENLKSKTHLGSTGNLGLEILEAKLKSCTLTS